MDEDQIKLTLTEAAAFFASDEMAEILRNDPELARRLAANIENNNALIKRLLAKPSPPQPLSSASSSREPE